MGREGVSMISNYKKNVKTTVHMILHGNDAADTYFKNGTLGTP